MKEHRTQTMQTSTQFASTIPRVDQMPLLFVIKPDVSNWTTENVGDWLCCLGEAYRSYRFLFGTHGIDGSTLLGLQNSDYNRLGLTNSLHVLRIEVAVDNLKNLAKWYEQQGNDVDLLDSSAFDVKRFVNRICNLRSNTLLTLVVKTLCERHRTAVRH